MGMTPILFCFVPSIHSLQIIKKTYIHPEPARLVLGIAPIVIRLIRFGLMIVRHSAHTHTSRYRSEFSNCFFEKFQKKPYQKALFKANSHDGSQSGCARSPKARFLSWKKLLQSLEDSGTSPAPCRKERHRHFPDTEVLP